MACSDQTLRMLLHDQCAFDVQLGYNKLLFNPYQESVEVLNTWLRYRYIYPNQDLFDRDYIADVVRQDMEQYGNEPAFMDFSNFDPGSVSEDFLIKWLSWYGVTGDSRANKGWYVLRATELLRLKRVQPSQHPFRDLLRLTKEGDTYRDWTQCASHALRDVPTYTYLPRLHRYAEEGNNTTLTKKQLLAKLLGGAAIAAPIILQYDNVASLKDIKGRLQSAEMIKELQRVGGPFILSYAANKLDPDAFTPKVRKAILRDIASDEPLPKNVIETLTDSESIWGQAFNYLVLPIISQTIKK